MDPKKSKPKTGSTPMSVDPTTAAKLPNLAAGGAKNIRITQDSGETRKRKIDNVAQNIMGRSFGGGPAGPGDVDPETGNILPADPRRPKKKRNVAGPAGPGDVDPETGDLIDFKESTSGDQTPPARSTNPFNFKDTAELKQMINDIANEARRREARKQAINDPLSRLSLSANANKSRMIKPDASKPKPGNITDGVLHERSIPFTEFPKTRAAPPPMDPELKRELEAIEARRRASIPRRDAIAAKYGMDTSGIDARKAKEFNPDGTLNPSYVPPPPSGGLNIKGTIGMGADRPFSPERLGYARARAAERDTQRTAAADAKKRTIMTTPGRGLSKETAAENQAVYDRMDAADAKLRDLEANRKTKADFMTQNKAERDAREKQIARDTKTTTAAAPTSQLDQFITLASRGSKRSAPTTSRLPSSTGTSSSGIRYNPTARAMGFGGRSTSPMNVGGGGGELKAKSARGNILASVQRGVENYLQEVYPAATPPLPSKPNNTFFREPKVRSNMPMLTPEISARMQAQRSARIAGSLERATGRKVPDTLRDKLGRAAVREIPGEPKPGGITLFGRRREGRKVDITPRTSELQASSARGLGEGVKKAGHPESFELGLDAETTGNPEYQKIRAEKEAERKKESQPSRANTEPSVQYKKETRKAKDSDEVAADRYARLHSRSKK